MAIDPSNLAKISLFEGLTASELALIVENSWERQFGKKSTIVIQEDPGETFYVILDGTVRVCNLLPNGTQVFLALLGTGDTVGEMALIDKKGRSANVVTQEQTRLLCVGRAAFDELMANGSTFPRNLMRILARRLRLTNIRLQQHCTLSVSGIVAAQIIEFADGYGEKLENGAINIPIRLTQQDIADLVGATRERVNQVIGDFRKGGHIELNGQHRITILNRAGLERQIQYSS